MIFFWYSAIDCKRGLISSININHRVLKVLFCAVTRNNLFEIQDSNQRYKVFFGNTIFTFLWAIPSYVVKKSVGYFLVVSYSFRQKTFYISGSNAKIWKIEISERRKDHSRCATNQLENRNSITNGRV